MKKVARTHELQCQDDQTELHGCQKREGGRSWGAAAALDSCGLGRSSPRRSNATRKVAVIIRTIGTAAASAGRRRYEGQQDRVPKQHPSARASRDGVGT